VQALVKHALVVLAACTTALVIASCDGRPGAGSKAPPPPATPQTLRRGLGGEPATLVPALADDNAALAVLGDLFEGLTAEAADGTIVPGAAERWTTSPDGRRWTFTLRPGLQWSNGEPLHAAHFERALIALLDPGSPSPYAQLLDGVTGVRAADERTVEFTTSRPLPQLPVILALPFAAPLYESSPGGDPSISNGPYRLASRTPGVSLQLERNPRYHAAADVRIEHVRYLTLDDLGTELNLYRAGELDVTSEVPNASID